MNLGVACEGVWGASSEVIGRFAMNVFPMPMALVMRMREVRSCGKVLYQRRRHGQRCRLVDIGVLRLPRLVVFHLSPSWFELFSTTLVL